MSFNTNSRIIGQHATLSPSTYTWLEYDEDKLRRVYYQRQQAKRGDQLHELAKDLISLGVKLPDNNTTLSMYVNDAIGFRMKPEVRLYYSDECFGQTDACGFNNNTLRIFDLKTGISPASMKQLKIYAGIFCLEYNFSPLEIRIILRIYQNDAIEELEADPTDIMWVMDRIKTQSALIAWLRKEEED